MSVRESFFSVDFYLDVGGSRLGSRVIPSCILVLLPINHQGVIRSLAFPRTAGVGGAWLHVLHVHRWGWEVHVAFHTFVCISSCNHSSIPHCLCCHFTLLLALLVPRKKLFEDWSIDPPTTLLLLLLPLLSLPFFFSRFSKQTLNLVKKKQASYVCNDEHPTRENAWLRTYLQPPVFSSSAAATGPTISASNSISCPWVFRWRTTIFVGLEEQA